MIHSFKLGGLNIVLDVFSGSVHIVDDIAFDMINMFEDKTEDEIVTAILSKYNEITKEERKHLLELTRAFPFTITVLRDYKEAIITKGGVDVKNINPKTMESKLVSGLYFVGEVLDVDALTGGFNLQVAWSTAYAAAK